MLGLGRILISDLVVANLLVYSLPVMILLYLAAPFFTPKVFLDEIIVYKKQGHSRRSGWPSFSQPTFSQGKIKIPFYTKQVINKSARVIWLC